MIQWIFVFYITPDIRRNAAEGDSGEKQQWDWCALKHTDRYQQVRYGDFRGTETTRCVLKRDSRRNAVNWGFFGDCGNWRVCFKAHVDYFKRTIVLPQITNAVSSIRTAAVAEGDSSAVGNTIELLFLNQRIGFPA